MLLFHTIYKLYINCTQTFDILFLQFYSRSVFSFSYVSVNVSICEKSLPFYLNLQVEQNIIPRLLTLLVFFLN